MFIPGIRSQGMLKIAGLALCLFLGHGNLLDAQANPPVPITVATTGFSQPDLALDQADNLLLTYIWNDDVWYGSSINFFQAHLQVTSNPVANSHTRITAAGLGSGSVIFEQDGSLPASVGGDILLSSNGGGPFSSPVNITFSAAADTWPVITRGFGTLAHMAWNTETTPGVPEVWFRAGSGAAQMVAAGSRPDVIDTSTATVIAYERAGVIYTRHWDGVSLTPETPIPLLPGPSESIELAAEFSGTVHAVFLSSGSVYYTMDSGSGFVAPVQLEVGPISGRPRIASNSSGQRAITYAMGGQIIVVEGPPADPFGPPQVVSGPTTTASEPTIAVDSNAYFRVVYVDGGLVRVNNVPPPVADFAVDVTSGEILLPVSFMNLSAGIIQNQVWDFGDGGTSVTNNPSHVYEAAGVYTVSLTVIGPGGSHTETKTAFISALAPTHIIEIPNIIVNPAQINIRLPILATHQFPMQGFQLVCEYNHSQTPVSASLVGTITAAANPDFVFPNSAIAPGGAGSWFSMVVVLDLDPPFLGQTIPVGNKQMIATLDFSIPIAINAGTVAPFRLVDDVYPPGQPIQNVFTQAGFSVRPFLVNGSATVASTPQPLFIRGDANSNQAVDLADAIYILGFLFSNGPAPSCPDAADVNDSSPVDIADAIFLLGYLFNGGQPPLYPFPNRGVDSSPDSLGPCMP